MTSLKRTSMVETETASARPLMHLPVRPLAALSILAFALGMVGYVQLGMRDPGACSLAKQVPYLPNYAYATIQLYVLNGPYFDSPVPVLLQCARIAAPASTLLGAWTFLRAFLDEPRRRWGLRRMQDHVLVVGDGEIADALFDGLAHEGTPVVQLTSRDGVGLPPPGARSIAFTGLPMTDVILGAAGVERCACIVLADADDNRNIERMGGLAAHLEQREVAREVPCLMQVLDADLRRLIEQRGVFCATGRLAVTCTNVYETEARRLMMAHPLDRVRTGPDSQLRIHLSVVGMGSMGESILLQAVRQGHYANGPVDITVYDRRAALLEKQFHDRFPGLEEVVPVSFVALDAEDPALVEHLVEDVRAFGPRATVVLSLPDESRNVVIAMRLVPELRRSDAQAWVRIPAGEGLREVLVECAGDDGQHLFVLFGSLREISQLRHLRSPRRDAQAEYAHEDYRRRRRAEGADAQGVSRQPWETLDPRVRGANREQVDHIDVKLRAIGCHVFDQQGTALQAFERFDDDEVELLARMEHQRWWAERTLAGWHRTDSEKDVDALLSPHLTSWERLPAEVQEWDREAVRNIPELVRRSGREIAR